MQAYIISDHDSIALRVRDVLLRAGADCPAQNVLPLTEAADQLVQVQPGLVVLALTPDPVKALALLGKLHAFVRCPLLVVGSTADPRSVLQAMRSGAADYVDDAEIAAELPAALGRIRSCSPGQAELGRIVAVLAPSGGSGSSTLAANVATTLAGKYKSTLLVDLKLQTGDLSALFDLRPTHTLADLCQNASRLDRVMFERSLARHGSGVHLLAPTLSIADVGYITADGVGQVLDLGRTLFPFVVIDLDHSFGPEQVQALRLASVVLLVLRLDFTCLRNAQRTLDHLDRLGISRDRVRVVVNRYGQAKEVPAAQAESALGVKIAHYVPEDAKTVNRANNNGVPVVLESPSARVAKSLVNLAASVNGKLGH